MSAVEAQPQHMTALQWAQAVRLRRAEQRRRVAAMATDDGRRAVASLLLEDPAPWWAASAMAVDVMAWPRRWGSARAERAFVRALPFNFLGRRLGQLCERERRALAREMWRGID